MASYTVVYRVNGATLQKETITNPDSLLQVRRNAHDWANSSKSRVDYDVTDNDTFYIVDSGWYTPECWDTVNLLRLD